jgi:mRNA deadenylase 3'-5' endonuclease subunit Ccr4
VFKATLINPVLYRQLWMYHDCLLELASKQFEAQFSELLNKSGSELDAIQKELRELIQKDEQITHRDNVSLAIIKEAIQELSNKLNLFITKQSPILHQLDTLRQTAATLLKTHDENRYRSITEEVKQSLEQESHLFTPIH